MKEQPGSLPLLEFVLTELWQQRQGGQLSHEAYERIGGLQGAIARRAEEVFTALTVAEQQTARRVFLQLVHVGEGTETTRQRAACAALGEESVRERRSMTAFPPTYYLHVWWARRPLVASRAAVQTQPVWVAAYVAELHRIADQVKGD